VLGVNGWVQGNDLRPVLLLTRHQCYIRTFTTKHRRGARRRRRSHTCHSEKAQKASI